jgi:phosphate-selective porin OprO/OprP
VGSGNNFLPRYRTPGQEQFFGYGGNIAADGERLRKTVQCYYYRGTFGVLGEWIESSQDVRVASGTGAGTRATLRNDAWQISGGWVLTGEDAGYRGVVKPSSPFAIGGDGWGALELAARYGRLEIDEGAFPLFANAASSAQAIRSWGLGLNWYLTQNFKLVTNYTQASFDGGAAAGADRADEKALFTRAQLSF